MWQLLSNADGFSPSVKPFVIVFYNLFLKNYLEYIILLMVIKTNYANKIYIKHQKQKIKVK